MPASSTPEAVYDVAAALLACARTGVAAAEGASDINRACVVWGSVALDQCECGELYVSIGRQAPSANFPLEGSSTPTGKCGPPIWMVTYSVVVASCVPIEPDPPPCPALEAAARRASIDAWAVRNGVACCLLSMQRDLTENGATAITNFLIRDQVPYGPEGGCAGSVLTAVVGLRHCQCVEVGS